MVSFHDHCAFMFSCYAQTNQKLTAGPLCGYGWHLLYNIMCYSDMVSKKNVYIFIHEKHEIGSTITNSMVSVVLPWKTGIKYIYGTYDMNMVKVRPIWNVNGEMDWSKWFNT